MVWRALLAARSPPRLRRWRSVLPELAGMGAAPQRWARAASERSRSGLSPAVVSSWPATSGPTPNRALSVWCGLADRRVRSRRSSVVISAVEGLDAAGDRGAARLWWRVRGSLRRVVVDGERGAAVDQDGCAGLVEVGAQDFRVRRRPGRGAG